MKVCILMGGRSNERDISIKSAREIFKSMSKEKYFVTLVDVDKSNDWIECILRSAPDIVINALHGGLGEDGSVQGLLQSFNIPFLGSGVMASSLCIDKSVSKDIMKFHSIPVAPHVLLKRDTNMEMEIYNINKMSYPLVVKPNKGGSSIGVNIVNNESELNDSIQSITDDDILVEKYMLGKEITCCIIENKNELEVMTILDINSKNFFYDYNAKYVNTATNIEFSKLPDFLKTMIHEISKKAFRVLGCSQYATVDMIVNEEQITVIEINTLPGLTTRSLMYKAAIEKYGGLGNFIDILIENRLECLNKKGSLLMSKEIISTENAPGAIGPYSQGIKSGNFVFTSGQLPINPENNELITEIKAATTQSLENLKAILLAGGANLENIVKVTIFVKDLNDFTSVNEVYATYFKENPPARSCFQVAKLPMDAVIEIEAIAVV